MNTSFERSTMKEDWLTPPDLLAKLGSFDFDPCSPVNRPWDTAKKHYTILDDGLRRPWEGRTFCNPPYGSQTHRWLARCADHGNAIALIFARTETKMFFDHIWHKADALLFIKGRLCFYTVEGKRGGAAGAPSVLVAYGKNNAACLRECGIAGKVIEL